MAKTERTKEKLLALMDILRNETDEDHHLTAQDIIDLLSQQGIYAERKSLYRNLSVLEEAGWDILHDRQGYYLASNTFELAELKLLVDAIQCSRFITEKKSYELIGKLETLTSQYRAKELRRQLWVVGRPKTSNEQIYYNIDAIYSAINQNCEICFYYLEWHSDGKRSRRDKQYRASPYNLCWDQENYYLVADTASRGRTHFRVDKMEHIQILNTPRQNPEQYRDLNMAEYSKRIFGMFGGTPTMVKLQFPESLADSAVDKFGSDIMMIPQHDDTFTVTVKIDVSPVFFSWVFSFAGRVKILGPDLVVAQYRELCRKTLQELE